MSEQVLPFYLVCDESGSMASHIDMMNNVLLPDLHQAIGADPVTADKTRFSIIGFAEDARVLLPLTDLGELESMPGLVARGTTNYGDAFRLLQQTIDADVTALKAVGTKVYRPAVFFLSDGFPTDLDWTKPYGALIDPDSAYRPNIVSFGLGGDADETVIAKVGTVARFMVKTNQEPGEALKEFAKALTRSISDSGRSGGVPGTGMTLQIPEQIPGFTPVPADAL